MIKVTTDVDWLTSLAETGPIELAADLRNAANDIRRLTDYIEQLESSLGNIAGEMRSAALDYSDSRLLKFEDIKRVDDTGKGGRQKLYHFKNGYGASVIKHNNSYGGKSDLWELAVLQGEELCYETEITSDVIGHLKDPDVDQLLGRIADL